MFDSIFGIHEQAIQVRKQRQDILANNLANADTPNYKARDLDWRKAMSEANDIFESGRYKTDMNTTNGRHIGGSGEISTHDFIQYRNPTQPSLDGNTVETHIEKAKYMENAIQYQATLNFLDGKISSIRGALKGE